MVRPLVNPERNAEIIRRRKSGQAPIAIARDMKVSRNTVLGVCRRAGLTSSPVVCPAKRPKPIPRTNSGAGFRGALGMALAADTGRADRLLRKFSWEQDA